MSDEIRLKLFRGMWAAVWFEPGRGTQRRSLRTADRGEAERRLIDFRADMAAPPGALVGNIVDAYLEAKRGRVAAHDSLTYAWQQARATFSHLRPDQINERVCRGYTKMRRTAGRADGTILKEINVVRQALNWRKIGGAAFEAPPTPPPRDRHLTKDEYRRLLDGCRQPHVRLYVILALATAARKTALLQLTWDRVDFDRGQIRLAVVGDRNRKGRALVPMNDRARAELEQAKRAALSPYVIEYGGRAVDDIRKGFEGAVSRAGLVDVRPHDLRHSAAVWMAEAGVSMDEIAQYLGHSSPSVTFRVYARFSPDHLRRAASALEF